MQHTLASQAFMNSLVLTPPAASAPCTILSCSLFITRGTRGITVGRSACTTKFVFFKHAHETHTHTPRTVWGNTSKYIQSTRRAALEDTKSDYSTLFTEAQYVSVGNAPHTSMDTNIWIWSSALRTLDTAGTVFARTASPDRRHVSKTIW